MHKIYLFLSTLKYLKISQICYRIYYLVRVIVRKIVGFKYLAYSDKNLNCRAVFLDESVPFWAESFKPDVFNFLNIEHVFQGNIDWNFQKYGKLWTYNLNYFDFLTFNDLPKEEGLRIIQKYLVSYESRRIGLEPYPTSLRGINWIKFLSRHNIENVVLNKDLYAQYELLLDSLEYHLLGNHLLENGFSLLFGGYYFHDDDFYDKGMQIVMQELDEQILSDGAHFELSPMYHQIVLFRTLDCINLISNNPWKNGEGLEIITDKASLMLGWLEKISYSSLDIPMFNDSTRNIAPSTIELLDYAQRLGVSAKEVQLGESGYRKITKENYECILDVGNIQAEYIPGHTHADTFNFEVRIDGKPFIVDSGTGTYEANLSRHIERSTKSHNTVEVMCVNSSEVWGGFRVGSRASVLETKESNNKVSATHDGYVRKFDILCTRNWFFEDSCIIIADSLSRATKARCYIHFDPEIAESEIKKRINTFGLSYDIQDYQYVMGFNYYVKAKKIVIPFCKELTVKINCSSNT